MKNILRNDEAPQDLALAEDLVIPGEWLVEYFDDDGADYVTIFTGQEAEARARDYRDALKEGRLGAHCGRQGGTVRTGSPGAQVSSLTMEQELATNALRPA